MMHLDAMTIALTTILLFYAAFLLWYGGRGRPLSAAESDAFLQSMRTQGVDRDDPDLFAALQRLLGKDDGREFLMVNLIRYRDKAAYPSGTDFGDSVRAADRRYARAFIPWLVRYGSLPVFVGRRSGSFIEPTGAEDWQVVAIVRYRSRRDFIRTARAVADKDVLVHKWASIERTHVFPVRPVFSFIAVRLAAGVLFGLAAAIAWAVLR